MEKNFDLKELLLKPVAIMTGEELLFLLNSRQTTTPCKAEPVVSKRMYYGISGIAEIFACSVPTANRIKKSGIINDAITQIGRKIIVDGEKALALVKESRTFKTA